MDKTVVSSVQENCSYIINGDLNVLEEKKSFKSLKLVIFLVLTVPFMLFLASGILYENQN